MLKRMITRKLAMAAKKFKHVDVPFLLLISRISSAESTSPKMWTQKTWKGSGCTLECIKVIRCQTPVSIFWLVLVITAFCLLQLPVDILANETIHLKCDKLFTRIIIIFEHSTTCHLLHLCRYYMIRKGKKTTHHGELNPITLS